MNGPAPEAAAPSMTSQRGTVLALFARFTDELLFGASDVLRPTIRAALVLSYTQVGALSLVLQYVAALVEPVNGLLIDVWQRRWLLAFGAATIGLATALIGLSSTFTALLVAFALYGAGSGPLAHTADVVLVEGHHEAPERVFARATALDTVGALLGPALVTAWLSVGLDWRWLLVALGSASLAYTGALLRTQFAHPGHVRTHSRGGALGGLAANVRTVLADREALFWLVFLRVHYVIEAPFAFRAIWLAEQGGMSQALVGLYVAVNTGCALLGVLALERWLHRVPPRSVLLASTGGVLVLFPAWFAVSGTWPRFVVGAPLAFLFAIIWPIARSASLNTASRRPGAVSAVNSVTGLLPVTFAIGVLAERVGLTAASLGVHVGAALVLLLLAWHWLPRQPEAQGQA